jgi:hypothetical protein
MREIQASYRVVGEREPAQPIFQEGGLGRLAYLLFVIGVVVALNQIISPVVHFVLDAPIRQLLSAVGF